MKLRITKATSKRLGGAGNADIAKEGGKYFVSYANAPYDVRTTAWMLGIHEMLARLVHTLIAGDDGRTTDTFLKLRRILGGEMLFRPSDGDKPSIEYIGRASDLTPTVMFVGGYRGWPVAVSAAGGYWKIATIRSMT